MLDSQSSQKVLAIIPARGGSKGVPFKNVKLLAGKPLIQHSIELALKCPLIDSTVVSTDDEQIAKVAIECGAEVVKRPPELAQDGSLVIDAIRYTVKELERQGRPFAHIVLLEPTSPLRRMQDLQDSIRALSLPGVDSVATFCEAKVSPNRLWRIQDGPQASPYIEGAVPWLPRQKQPVAYELNGQVYAFARKNLDRENQVTFLSDRIHPIVTSRDYAVDIDTEVDFKIAENLMKEFEL